MKKIILLLLLTVIVPKLSFGQNILFLKSGEKMNGKLEGYKNDSIIFKIQGNKLKFKTSEIITIYFDEKLVPQDLSKGTTINPVKSNIQGSILGVVTYYFNKNYGNKPDIGADIYVIDTANIQKFSYATVDSFYYAKFYKNLYLENKSFKTNEKIPNGIMEKVKEYNIEDELAFNSLDKRASANIIHLKYAKDIIKTVVDGSGNYSIKVKPGIYYVCIQSKHREGTGMTEIYGKIKCKIVNVKEGVDTNLSYNFELY